MRGPPAQTSLGQYSPGRRPIAEWLQHIRAMPPIPFTRREPIIETGPYPYDGSENILAFWYCSLPWDLSHPRYDPCLEVMTPIYDLAQMMIADGWIISACDIKPRRGQNVEIRLVAYRWIAEEVLSGRYLLSLATPLGREAVPVRCSEVWL